MITRYYLISDNQMLFTYYTYDDACDMRDNLINQGRQDVHLEIRPEKI